MRYMPCQGISDALLLSGRLKSSTKPEFPYKEMAMFVGNLKI